jgi:hypothetical protein
MISEERLLDEGTVLPKEHPMNKSSTLYWSHLKMYEECPQQFLWRKGWDQVDFGFGPGNPRPNPSDDPKHHAVMGIAIQYAVEKMYNDELYRDPANLRDVMLDLAEREFHRQEEKPRNRIDYDKIHNMTRAEMLQTVRDGVVGYLATMKAHRFLGPYAKSEVDLLGWIDKWNPIGGRADMIIRRDDTGITMLDGKNTKHKMKYTDPDQLRWYALLFKLAYREIPNRLGFVWFRFPHGMVTRDDQGNEITETGVEWIDFTEDDLKGLAQRALDAKKGMMKEKFDPTPTPKICRFCDFEDVCKARQIQRAANAAKRGPRRAKKVEAITDGDGFSDFSL